MVVDMVTVVVSGIGIAVCVVILPKLLHLLSSLLE